MMMSDGLRNMVAIEAHDSALVFQCVASSGYLRHHEFQKLRMTNQRNYVDLPINMTSQTRDYGELVEWLQQLNGLNHCPECCTEIFDDPSLSCCRAHLSQAESVQRIRELLQVEDPRWQATFSRQSLQKQAQQLFAFCATCLEKSFLIDMSDMVYEMIEDLDDVATVFDRLSQFESEKDEMARDITEMAFSAVTHLVLSSNSSALLVSDCSSVDWIGDHVADFIKNLLYCLFAGCSWDDNGCILVDKWLPSYRYQKALDILGAESSAAKVDPMQKWRTTGGPSWWKPAQLVIEKQHGDWSGCQFVCCHGRVGGFPYNVTSSDEEDAEDGCSRSDELDEPTAVQRLKSV